MKADKLNRDILIIGIGGCGCNVIGSIHDVIQAHGSSNVASLFSLEPGANRGIRFVAMNTDLQSLERTVADARIFLGGNDLPERPAPETAVSLAEDKAGEIAQVVREADAVILIAGMGGATGTLVAPVVARIAGELAIRTAGCVTMPFSFEGIERMEQAEKGLGELQSLLDTLTVFPNDKLLMHAEPDTSMADAFRLSDHAICSSVLSVVETV